jgi:hypothetical protein
MAASSHPSSHRNGRKLKKNDPSRADHLYKFRWEKGVSGNKAGKRPQRQLTGILESVFAMPMPPPLRQQVEDDLHMTLENDLSIEKAAALKFCFAMLGHGGQFRLDIFEEGRAMFEGPLRQMIFEAMQELSMDQAPEEDGVERALRGMVRNIIDRAKSFGIDPPPQFQLPAEVIEGTPTVPGEAKETGKE